MARWSRLACWKRSAHATQLCAATAAAPRQRRADYAAPTAGAALLSRVRSAGGGRAAPASAEAEPGAGPVPGGPSGGHGRPDVRLGAALQACRAPCSAPIAMKLARFGPSQDAWVYMTQGSGGGPALADEPNSLLAGCSAKPPGSVAQCKRGAAWRTSCARARPTGVRAGLPTHWPVSGRPCAPDVAAYQLAGWDPPAMGCPPPCRDEALEAAAAERELTVSFNADVADGMPWRFLPAQRSVKVGHARASVLAWLQEHAAGAVWCATAVREHGGPTQKCFMGEIGVGLCGRCGPGRARWCSTRRTT